MKKSIIHFRIPTYLGAILLLLVVMATSWLVNTNTFIKTKASPTYKPENIQITNISDTTATISYTTADLTTGTILYGNSVSLVNVSFDNRDQTLPSAHREHYISLTNLKPETTYYFTINSGDTKYKNNNEPFSFKTGPHLKNANEKKSIQGLALLPNGGYPKEANVFLQTANSQILSTMVGADGKFSLDINSLRDDKLQKYISLQDTDVLDIWVTGDNLVSKITVQMKDSQSIPPITLSNQYNFILNALMAPDGELQQGKLPKFSNIKALSKTPQILVPTENQGFHDYQPAFSGTALPNKQISLIINGEKQLKVSVQSDKDGLWSYRPPKPLDPGQYTFTMSTRDEANMLHTLSQSFSIFAIGTQQFFEPSPGITETITPTQPAATATPTMLPTATPTLMPTDVPTTIPTVQPTDSPLPTIPVTVFPTSSSPIPTLNQPPGSNEIIFTAGIAIFATITGIMLFFLTRI